MVSVLPAAPTFGSEFGRGLGAGVGQTLPQVLDQFYSRKREAREREQLKGTLEQLGLPTELSQLPTELQREFIKQKFQEDKLKDLLQIVEGFQTEATPVADEATQPSVRTAPAPPQITDQQILGASLIDPTLGKMLQSQKEAGIRSLEKREERAFQRSKKYLDNLSEIAQELPKERLALQQMRGALDVGDFESKRNAIAEILGLDLLKTAGPQVVNSASKQFLMSSLASLRGRPNQFVERQITRALINPLYQKEANELIYEGLEGLHRLKQREVEIANELEERYTDRGEEIPRNYQKQVRETLQKEAEEFEKRYEERVRTLLSSKEPLRKVKKGTPLTRERAQHLLNQVGGDKEEARKLARSLGYEL